VSLGTQSEQDKREEKKLIIKNPSIRGGHGGCKEGKKKTETQNIPEKGREGVLPCGGGAEELGGPCGTGEHRQEAKKKEKKRKDVEGTDAKSAKVRRETLDGSHFCPRE